MNKIYSDQIAKAISLSDGIERNRETLIQQGITINTDAMNSYCKELEEVAKQQEDAELALKKVRDEAHRLLDLLKAEIIENKNPIKLKFLPDRWQQFGIADKR